VPAGRTSLTVPQIHKFYIVTEMLTGRIPDRTMFRRPVLQQALVPYFQIVQGRLH
jgi:26S proteasome regulatory subunit N3